MSDIRVKGFDDISFWREDDIGLIVLRSNEKGQIGKKTIDELIMALSTASIDASVESIAITGQNEKFAVELLGWENPSEVLNSLRALVSIMYSLEKPIFAIINGDAVDIGYEIALLCDVAISSPVAKLGFSKDYHFCMAGSVSSLRYSQLEVTTSTERVNCDYVFPPSDLLGEAKTKIQEISSDKLVLRRKSRLRSIKEAMGEEHYAILSKLNEGQNEQKKSREIGV